MKLIPCLTLALTLAVAGVASAQAQGDCCPQSQGTWKNTPTDQIVAIFCDEEEESCEAADIVLGLLNASNSGKKADATVILAHQYAAALLNLINCESFPNATVADAFAAAGVLFENNPVGSGIRPNSDLGKEMLDAAGILDLYNNGWFSDCDGDGSTPEGGDCDDSDPGLNPDDADEDGYSTCDGDCDDDNADVNPGATEVADNQIDDDCDGEIDEVEI